MPPPDFTHVRCGGTWEPLHGWVGRYRCSKCGAFGYRRGINDMASKGRAKAWSPEMCGVMPTTREYITEYRCSHKGCDKPAVAKDKKLWRCAEHRRP